MDTHDGKQTQTQTIIIIPVLHIWIPHLLSSSLQTFITCFKLKRFILI